MVHLGKKGYLDACKKIMAVSKQIADGVRWASCVCDDDTHAYAHICTHTHTHTHTEMWLEATLTS